MKLIERSKCPYCEEIKFNSLYKKNYNSEILQLFFHKYYKNDEIKSILKSNIYEITECIKCNGLFQKYIPDENLSYFLYEKLISSDESFNKKKNIIHTNFKEYSLDAEIIKNLLNKKNNEIKILEFGSGWGFWAKFMKELNFNVEAVEISESRINHLNKNNIKNYKIINETNKKYDIIFSNQALEHISYPLQTIRELYDKLLDNGVMFHKFPSSFLFKRKLLRNYVPKKDCAHPLEHINIFNKKCFKKICEITNLRKINVKNLNLINKIKTAKNEFIFNQIILRK